MPRAGNAAKRTILTMAALALTLAPATRAQYVGHVDTSKSKGPTLRATAVLEYTGDLDKPTASRLVPIAVWDGERYQPGGLYMAQPIPLTVLTGTQYVLEDAGTPKGLFDVKAAADVGGSWIAIGNYQKPPTPKEAKLKASRQLPVIVDDSKPHFAHVPTGDAKEGATNAKPQNNAPPVDPDRPTLHQRSGEQSGGQHTEASNPAPPIDPDRPVLREPAKTAAQAQQQASNNGSPETVTQAVDPNRPHLEYGKPSEQESLGAPEKVIATLAGPQPEIEQIAAVSDAVTRSPHSYEYSWSSPEDEKKMQGEVEAVAQQLLAASEPKPFGEVKEVSHRRSKSKKTVKPAKPALPTLTDEQFKAYELSYGGGATLVFSATEGQGEEARYITLIAQPDFNGTPIVLFKQITSERDLSIVPRMKLIDAVDTDADNRAELIFALENNMGRHYAIYRVANGTAEQVFATGG
jgi:hypothetical protein